MGGSYERGSGGSRSVAPPNTSLYKQNVRMNVQKYNNGVTGTYNNAQKTLGSNLGGIYGGFSGLQNQVMHTLGVDGGGWGVAAPAAQAIAQTFAKQQGAAQQNMINSGLGNSTVLSGLSNANALNAGQAIGSLGSQLAQTAAGYQSQIGMAGLDARMKGAGMQADLSKAYMGDSTQYKFSDFAPNMGQTSSSWQSSQGQSANSPFQGGSGGSGQGNIGDVSSGGGNGNPDSFGSYTLSPIDYQHGGAGSMLSGGNTVQQYTGDYAGMNGYGQDPEDYPGRGPAQGAPIIGGSYGGGPTANV